MSESVRAFLAVDLSDEAREMLTRVADRLGDALPPDVRVIPPENLHLTLKFLGNFPEAELPRLVRAVLPRVIKTKPFEIEIGGLGAFPSARAARVVWVGVMEGGAPLARLARQLESATSRVGVDRERRPYRGHLTLARLRTPARVHLDELGDTGHAPVPVREVVLYRSDLSSSGARYTALARFPLGEACEPEIDSLIHPPG
jgi:2'-5' RNA ligase